MKHIKLTLLLTLIFLTSGCIFEPKVTTEINLASNLSIEYMSNTYLYDLISITDGTITDANTLIDTSNIGEKEITINYKDSNNHKKKYSFNINIRDSVNPILNISKNIYVNVNSSLDLYTYIFCGDNETRNVNLNITGDYDLNTIGDYPLEITATDNSNNIVNKSTTLHVIEATNKDQTETVGKPLSYYIKSFKNSDNTIGIDISSHQKEIDFEAVKNAGIDFVMIRAGYGPDSNMLMTEDTYFEDNYTKAKEAGLKVGVYLYSYATTLDEVDIQTDWLSNILANKELDLPIAYDWESWNTFYKCNLNFYDLNNLANKFLETMNSKGYQVMNYGSKYYLDTIWNTPKYAIWLAQYNNEVTYEKDFYMWQLSEIGNVDGISTLVDIDIKKNIVDKN